MFVTQSDFDLIPYNLVNLPDDETFVDFINEQEEEHLRLLLGNLFYDALVVGIDSLPDLYVVTTEYAINDEVRSGIVMYKSLVGANMGEALTDITKWEVVVDADRARWLKLLVGENYVYNDRTSKWVGMVKLVKPLIYSLWINPTHASVAGRVVTNVENANVVDPAQDICRGWNAYHKIACGVGNKWLDQENTLYGYLISVSANFAELNGDTLESYLYKYFTNPKSLNVFGI